LGFAIRISDETLARFLAQLSFVGVLAQDLRPPDGLI
jgi:hypothetical protein